MDCVLVGIVVRTAGILLYIRVKRDKYMDEEKSWWDCERTDGNRKGMRPIEAVWRNG